jgi:hypothetical protein
VGAVSNAPKLRCGSHGKHGHMWVLFGVLGLVLALVGAAINP